MRVRWTAFALRDLEAIGDYIGNDDAAAAKRIVSAIFAQTDRLVEYPQIGRLGRVEGTRELVVAPFIIPYRPRPELIEILAVFHGARRWPASFD